ncbi:MAG: ABC transporter permease [Eubacteriales bacterium]|nr:ABC transporter permease [Eubacteriales bacterium]
MTWEQLLPVLWEGTLDTLYMTLWSSVIAYALGLPLGVLLVVTRKGHIMPAPAFNSVLGVIVNFLRSIPFIIMLAVLFPVTRVVMGTAIGTTSIIFPLIISAFPYVARMVESSLEEVDHGILEAAQSMGSTNWQIIWKVLLPEAVPSLVNGAAISVTTILSYTALASAAGGGGLGALAIVKGLNIRKFDVMYSASLLLVALVQIITVFGTRFTRGLDHKRRL